MAHKTLIGGTAYTIKGGKDLIAGTSYAKKQGKALVAGTAQTIAFSKKIKVTITGRGNGTLAYVTYKGTKYISATTFEAETGDTLTLVAKDSNNNYRNALVEGKNNKTPYEYTLHTDVKIGLSVKSLTTSMGVVTLTLE